MTRMTILGTWSLAVVGAMLSSACDDTGRPAPLDPALSAAQWREDLHTVARELPKRHANAFHMVSRSSFDSAVSALDSAIPHLGPDSAVVGLRRVVTMIGDGHTNLSLPGNWSRLPVRFTWFGDPVNAPADLELRVTAAAAPFEHALAARVIRIGDSATSGAYAALTGIIAGGESEGSRREASAAYMRVPQLLHGLGIVPRADIVTLVLADSVGRESTVAVRPVTPATRIDWHYATSRQPLYLSRPDDPYWFTMLADATGDSSTVYVALGGYPDWIAFWRRSRELFTYIDEHKARRLVIDLRDNGGGDFNKVRRLLIPGLRARATVSTPGRLYVLIGPATFSAAMTNAVDLRRDLHAILVGEPTGARPNGYQEGASFTLPNSHLKVTVSTRYYRFQAEDTPGVLPDHYAPPSWRDYRAGRDPALSWVLAQPLLPATASAPWHVGSRPSEDRASHRVRVSDLLPARRVESERE